MYEEEQDDYENQSFTSLVKSSWHIILAGVFYYLFRARLGTSSFETAGIYAWGFIILVFMGKYSWTYLENKTTKFVFCHGFDTSEGRVKSIGNFSVIRPGVRAFNMYFNKPGAYFFPNDAVYSAGENTVCMAKLNKVTFDELPPECRQYISEENIREPYVMGLADPSQYRDEIDNPDATEKSKAEKTIEVSRFILLFKSLTKTITFMEKELKEVRNLVEDKADWERRIKGKSTFLERLMPPKEDQKNV